jgi:dolichol-phosphate mannosyltransferase
MTENTNPAVDAMNQSFHQKIFSNILLLIPTLNEEEAVGSLVVEAGKSGFTDILVVDGFSTDGTRKVAVAAGAMVIEQEFGKGKGCGVRTGMKVFLQGSADLLCIIDGDGTNIPSGLKEMIPLVEHGRADVVLGSRIRGKRDPGAMSLLAVASNLTVSFLLGAKFKRLFTDVQTGYWLFSRRAVARIYPLIHSTDFEIELELFVTILREKLRICEVPVGFRRRRGTTKFSFVLRLRNLYYAFKYLSS